VHALPVADLLAQFEVIPAQGIHLGAQLGVSVRRIAFRLLAREPQHRDDTAAPRRFR
jgi:hypothetical protein